MVQTFGHVCTKPLQRKISCVPQGGLCVFLFSKVFLASLKVRHGDLNHGVDLGEVYCTCFWKGGFKGSHTLFVVFALWLGAHEVVHLTLTTIVRFKGGIHLHVNGDIGRCYVFCFNLLIHNYKTIFFFFLVNLHHQGVEKLFF